MVEEKRYSVKAVLDQIDRCVLYSNGVFLKTSVTENRRSKESLNQFCKRYPEAFKVLIKDGTSLLQATQIYASIRKLNKIIPTINDGTELLRSMVWSAFILQNDLKLEIGRGDFNYLGSAAKLDDFHSSYDDYFGFVVTIKARANLLNSNYYIPHVLSSKWADRIVSNLSKKIETNVGNDDLDFLITENLIEDGMWPEDEHDCHLDEREYPSLGKKINGFEKWKYDKYILQNGGKLPSGYKLGVYRN